MPTARKDCKMLYEKAIAKAHINENFSINTLIDDIMELIPDTSKKILERHGIKNNHANNVLSLFAKYEILSPIEGKTLRRSQYNVLKVNQSDGYSKVVIILSHKKDGGKIALKINRQFFSKREHDNGTIAPTDCSAQLKAEYEFFKKTTEQEKQYLATISKYFQYKGVLVVECADYVFKDWDMSEKVKLQSHPDYASFEKAMHDMNSKYSLGDVLDHMSNIGIFNGKIKCLDYGYISKW